MRLFIFRKILRPAELGFAAAMLLPLAVLGAPGSGSVARHWSFIAPVRRALPHVNDSAWPQNAIDFFIESQLERESLRPSMEAAKITLLRRVTLDLTGLPPTMEEAADFLGDADPKAYERAVDRLLASPHYGERWGRHWLDVARYADSNGYSIDAPRSMWKYRDWVIRAFNQDMPFDQFVIDQLAGDLLPNPSIEQKIATGFHRNTQINQEGGIDPEQFRVESVIDRVNTTGTAFLGLTIGCAQCHNHKFDPITQREYYQLFAFFNNTVDEGHGKAVPGGMVEIPHETEPIGNVEKDIEDAEADLDRYLNTYGNEIVRWERSLDAEAARKLGPELRKILKIEFAQRSIEQKRRAYRAFRPDDSEFKQRESKLLQLEKRQPKPVTALVMVEQAPPRRSTILIKGDFTRPGEMVEPGVPAVLPELKWNRKSKAIPSRLDLARWIVDPANPLTARVAVNRIWQQYFGRGIVETENDFGTQGSRPSHPELLDWLATELIRSGWSLKSIHRLIVTSATYRQSSGIRAEDLGKDPNNRWLARQSRLRLDSEIVRDVCLSASGLLCEKVGGPSVFPPQPDGVMNLGQLKRPWVTSAGADRYRRGIYTFFWRATPYPGLMVFDSPDAFSACTRRVRSNTPLQALTLLNDPSYFECAQALAKRILREEARSDRDRVARAFRICLSRFPTNAETDRLLKLLADERKRQDGAEIEIAAWSSVSRVLLNLDEMITRE